MPLNQVKIEFWEERWKSGRIGFHEGRPNDFLVRHLTRLDGPGKERVLVPLCGKAEDLAFLAAQGLEVVGIEAVEDAAIQFYREHDLTPSVIDRAHGRVYEAALAGPSGGSVTIHVADLFACTLDALGGTKFNALYDRAALVALPDDVRSKYVEHLRSQLLEPRARALVITFEYEAGSGFTAPPFSVSEAEVRALYTGANVEQIDEGPAKGPKFQDAHVIERVFAITL